MVVTMGQKAGWGLADMGVVVLVVVKQLLILQFLTAFLGLPVAIARCATTGILLGAAVIPVLAGSMGFAMAMLVAVCLPMQRRNLA